MKNALNIICFWFAVTLAAYGFAKFTGAAIVNSTINSTTIGATTPSTVAATTLTASTSTQMNGSVLNTGTGFKHVRVTSCTTTAVANNFCNTTVTWPGSAFPDTNYTYGCSTDGDGKAAYQTTASGSKGTSSIVAVIQNTPGNSLAVSETLNCWAFHD